MCWSGFIVTQERSIMRKLGTFTTFKPDEAQKSNTDNIGYNSTGIFVISIFISATELDLYTEANGSDLGQTLKRPNFESALWHIFVLSIRTILLRMAEQLTVLFKMSAVVSFFKPIRDSNVVLKQHNHQQKSVSLKKL